ncbi:MAG: DNA-binding protein [Candidatus Entotheonellia bacterium]
MNESSGTIRLYDFMGTQEGWGRDQGREVYQKLLAFVDATPGVMIFKVSLAGVKRVDISFASETVVELARRYRGNKGFCFIDLTDLDMLENWEAAASRKGQPMMVWEGKKGRVIGVEPSRGNLGAFTYALERERTRATEFAAATPNMSIANASTKFKQLWEQGFLLRREDVAESGGVEFVYYRIG